MQIFRLIKARKDLKYPCFYCKKPILKGQLKWNIPFVGYIHDDTCMELYMYDRLESSKWWEPVKRFYLIKRLCRLLVRLPG